MITAYHQYTQHILPSPIIQSNLNNYIQKILVKKNLPHYISTKYDILIVDRQHTLTNDSNSLTSGIRYIANADKLSLKLQTAFPQLKVSPPIDITPLSIYERFFLFRHPSIIISIYGTQLLGMRFSVSKDMKPYSKTIIEFISPKMHFYTNNETITLERSPLCKIFSFNYVYSYFHKITHDITNKFLPIISTSFLRCTSGYIKIYEQKMKYIYSKNSVSNFFNHIQNSSYLFINPYFKNESKFKILRVNIKKTFPRRRAIIYIDTNKKFKFNKISLSSFKYNEIPPEKWLEDNHFSKTESINAIINVNTSEIINTIKNIRQGKIKKEYEIYNGVKLNPIYKNNEITVKFTNNTNTIFQLLQGTKHISTLQSNSSIEFNNIHHLQTFHVYRLNLFPHIYKTYVANIYKGPIQNFIIN